MKKLSFLLLLLMLASIIFPLFNNVEAGKLTSTIIRLEKQSVSKQSGGLVCTTTPVSDNGAENKLQIIFPTGFQVNQTASNWTVTTSDLPAGATAWPGINTATSVSGNLITFPSSNLAAATKYCFNFNSSNTLTTPSSSGSYSGTIRTLTSANSIIDDVEYALGIVANNGIDVSATVPANPTDFQADLELFHPPNGEFPQKAELIYKIKYGSYLTYPTNITLEAEWSIGTIDGNSIPTEDILEYEAGTATKGYNAVPPVIDTANRKITWTFSSFPGSTNNQAVFFRLTTKNTYQGSLPVAFSVTSRLLGPGTQTADSTVNSTYIYNSKRFNSSGGGTTSDNSTSTNTSTTPQQASLSPQQSEVAKSITSVEIRSVSDTQAQIFAQTSTPTAKKIIYGTNLNNLNQSVSVPSSIESTITLPNLTPNTRYFFRLIATSQDGQEITSDIYVFNTALSEAISKAVEKSLILSSGDVILFDPTKQTGETPNIVIPKNTRFAFKFLIENYQSVKKVEGIVRNSQVLGAKSDSITNDVNILTVTEIYPGQYIGSLTTSDAPGIYNLILKISEFNGSITEQQVSNLIIVDHFKIIDSASKNPIEKAKATFYFYNLRSRLYEPVSRAITPFDNPAFTGVDGYIPIVLPEGKFKAEIRAIGYKNKSAEFSIGANSPKYPVIELERTPFSLITYVEYTASNALDAINLALDYVTSFKTSGRYLELITSSVILLFIVLGLIQTSKIFGVPIYLLPFFALYHLSSLFYKPKHAHFIQGKVIDILSHVPVEGVLVHFAYPNGKIFAHARSNSNGDFTVSIKKPLNIKISISKRGYDTFSQKLSEVDLSEKLTVAITKSDKPDKFGLGTISWYFKSITNAFFESFLIITIIVELIFAQQFGFFKALPAIIISLGNFLIWALHARPKKAVKSRA